MAQRGARVLSLTLLGSRRFGFPTPSSDYDYVGVYQWPLKDYLGLQQKKTSYELSLDAETQVKWYELRSFLTHIQAGKPDFFRCIYASPCYADTLWPETALSVAPWYNPRNEWEAAAAWARKIKRCFEEGNPPSLKDFCHWAYRALAVKYVQSKDYFHLPLIDISYLALGTGLEEAVKVLVESRAAGDKELRENSFGPFQTLADDLCREGQVFKVPAELLCFQRTDLSDTFRNSLRKAQAAQ